MNWPACRILAQSRKDDLARASSDERVKWSGLAVDHDELVTETDARFEMWVERYLNGSCAVESGVVARLKYTVRELNALTFCTVGVALFKYEDMPGLRFPVAQNNRSYHDAHSEVYKLLIDGLDKDALVGLAGTLKIHLEKPDNARTLDLLGKLLPEQLRDAIRAPLDGISARRRLAGHQARPQAERLDAFEQFNDDLEKTAVALGALRDYIAAQLKVTVDSCMKRREAMTTLYPKLDHSRDIRPNYSICDIKKIEGKTISRVEFGWREPRPRSLDSELIILYFEDDSSMAIHMASNIKQLIEEHGGLGLTGVNLQFQLNFVPPIKRT